MRFRKRIKIAKGVSLNFSKSGVSTSFGMKGLSFTAGSRGTHINYGVPGTGLYDRKKISFTSSASSKSPNLSTKSNSGGRTPQNEATLGIQLEIDDSGNIQVFNSEGVLIEDQALLRKIKKVPEYIETIDTLKYKKFEEVQKVNHQFINIYQLTPNLKIESDWTNECKNLIPTAYFEKEFYVPQPSIEESILLLEESAKKEVKSILFWKNESKRQKFIDENLESFHQERIKKWETEKKQFLKEEIQRKNKLEEENKEIEKLRYEIENCVLTGKSDYINAKIEEILSTLELPVEFSVGFNFKEPDTIELDLDLPEIEDLPNENAILLSSGKLSIKQKTKKQILQDYAICVHGLAFFFTGLFFNISPKISQINIAGYTQRLDPKTGNIKDTYIYFIEFDRDTFSKLNVTQLSPVDAFENFIFKRKILKSFEMKEVEITS